MIVIRVIAGIFSVLIITGWIYGRVVSSPAAEETYTTVYGQLVSPDGSWRAYLAETAHLGEFPGFTEVSDSVHLASSYNNNASATILTVSEGDYYEAPSIAWTAKNVLRVTIANRSSVSVDRHEYNGIRIDVHYDPDDPAARQARLRQFHEPDFRIATSPD